MILPFGVSEDGIGEAERRDGCFELIDLALRMGAGITRIRNEIADRAKGNGEPRPDSSRNWFVHV